MSISTVEETMNRIKYATTSSPIAVFTCHLGDNPNKMLNSMFADTVDTQKLIKNKHHSLVGVYDQYMDLRTVRSDIRKAAGF